MIRRILWLICAFVAAVVLITLAVANRHSVQMVLDPFNPQRPVISTVLPFYVYLFAMMIVGIIMGGVATWTSQGKWRRLARTRAQDVARWRGEAERLQRERDARLGGGSESGPSQSGVGGNAIVGGVDKRQLALSRR